MCLAAADDVTRQRCVCIIRAASAGASSSSLHDIASTLALTPDLFAMRSLPALNAVLASLGKAAVAGLDAPSLKAAGCNIACCLAAGLDFQSLQCAGFAAAEVEAAGCDLRSAQAAGYGVPSLIDAYGLDEVIASGAAGKHVLVSCCAGCAQARARTDLSPPSPLFLHLPDLSPPSTLFLPLQRDGPNLYMTLHLHKIDDRSLVDDGPQPAPVPAGGTTRFPSCKIVTFLRRVANCRRRCGRRSRLRRASLAELLAGLCQRRGVRHCHVQLALLYRCMRACGCPCRAQKAKKQTQKQTLNFPLTPVNRGKVGERQACAGCARGESNAGQL